MTKEIKSKSKIEESQRLALIENLKEFGLTENEALIYIELTRAGVATSYKLHKLTGIGRSIIDSILEALVDKNLITLENTSSSKLYRAFPYKNLASLVEVKEAEVDALKKSLDLMQTNFSEFAKGSTKDESNVLHYYGVEGLKQVIWNTLRARKKMRIFEVSRLSAFLQASFAEKYRQEAVHRGIVHYDLTNESFMPGWTDVTEYIENHQKLRYIDPKILEIKFEIYIYNDVVGMLDYRNNELLCIEVQNKYLATLQKQLFDYVWKDAIEMFVTGPRGEMGIKD
ncbi:MAG: helix-turn-helix domain-containing protein [Patescibacteria group bacterium]|nr:hypothetical protein [Patescibacteria group bacterium]